MEDQMNLVRPRLKAPRAAAIAGIVFSVLFITTLVLVRISVPYDPREAGNWLPENWRTVSFAMSLVPFAGIAFMWFMAVLRDRVTHEDRFFDTVFLGSGFMFLAMLFISSALALAVIMIYGSAPVLVNESGIYRFARALIYQIMQVYAMRMAGVFMFLTCTLSLRAGMFPRWMSFMGFFLAALLLLSGGHMQWTPLVFPLWIMLISVYILFVNLKTRPGAS